MGRVLLVSEELSQLLGACQEFVGCDHAGITTRDREGRHRTLAVTSPLAERAAPRQALDGGCPAGVSGWGELDVVAIPDPAHDLRWPAWSAAVARLGVAAAVAAQVRSPAFVSGALLLYFDDRSDLEQDRTPMSRWLADQVGLALSHADTVSHLGVAMEARTRIGQAQGVLMERYGLDADEAFAVLRRYSQDSNTKLWRVAERLLTTGALDELGTLRGASGPEPGTDGTVTGVREPSGVPARG